MSGWHVVCPTSRTNAQMLANPTTKKIGVCTASKKVTTDSELKTTQTVIPHQANKQYAVEKRESAYERGKRQELA